MPRREHIKKVISNKRRRLEFLEQQQALTGFDTAPQILVEIEDLQVEIEELLASLEPAPQSPAPATAAPSAVPKLHPSLALDLSVKPEAVEVGHKATWTATIHNNGDDPLRQVIVRHGRMLLADPFDLAVGEKRQFTFTTSPKSKGQKTEQVTASGLAGNGESIRRQAGATTQARQPHPATPKAKPRPPSITKPFRVDLVHIPAGEFLMGSDPAKDKQAQEDEQPQHKLYLPQFYIGKYPVTNAQYAAFLEATGHKAEDEWLKKEKSGWFSSKVKVVGIKFPSGGETHPATHFSWLDAVAFCRWLSQESGQTVRLPTEAEWEKAARGGLPPTGGDQVGSGRIYPWGNEFDQTKLNSEDGGPGKTTPVGRYSPEGDSPYGVADMAGNVLEWCSTIWAEEAYPFQVQDEWSRDYLDITSVARVLRGGAFDYGSKYVRCSLRNVDGPSLRSNLIGFRIVRE